MKKVHYVLFGIIIGLILIGKILNWFLHFDDKTNLYLTILLFCTLGLYYIAESFIRTKTLYKITLLCCGSFLIIMNLFPKNAAIDIIGIICVLIPFFMKRANPIKDINSN